eukprot:5979250-Pyramimonas_sp.AAC.1
MQSDILAARAASEEIRRLRPDVEQTRMEKEADSTPAQAVHAEPPPCPIVVRPARGPGASRVGARSGILKQACHVCTQPSTDACQGCLKHACSDHLDLDGYQTLR